jgi:hypothetical protein
LNIKILFRDNDKELPAYPDDPYIKKCVDNNYKSINICIFIVNNFKNKILMEKFNRNLPVCILIAIAIVTLVPFVFTGFSNADDITYFIQARVNQFWTTANVYAKDQGRFHFLISFPIAECFYLFDNYLISKSINIIFVLINFIVVGYIVKELFHNIWYGYLCFCLIVMFISIKGLYNPIVSYPAYFSGSFLLILSAIYFALKFRNTEINKYRLLSAIFYGIGLLFYETYLTYLPLIIIIVHTNNLKNRTSILLKLKNILPFLLIGIIYCLVYFSYRVVYPSNYIGSIIASKISFSNFFSTLLNFASGSYPMKMTFSGGLTAYGGVDYFQLDSICNILYLILSEHFEWIFKSFIISILLYCILQKLSLPKPKQILTIFLIAFLYIYIPNVPISLTLRHLNSGGMPYYTTSYFSVFAVSICLTILIILLCSSIRNFKYKNYLYLIITIFFGLLSLINDFANYQAIKYLRVPLNVFNFSDKFARTEEYSLLPVNSYIYSPLYFDTREDIIHITEGFNWQNYLYFISNKKPIFYLRSKDELIKRIANNLKPNFYLNYGRNQNDKDQFFAFSAISDNSKIDSVNNYIVSDSATIYYYSKNKTFSICFIAFNNDNSFLINNETFQKSHNYIEFDVLNKNYKNDFVSIKLKAKEIDLNSIRVTNITKPGSLSITLN